MQRDSAATRVCTVLIPAFNEEGTIRTVVESALAHVERILVISDGSTDSTVARLNGLPVQIVDGEANLGKGVRIAEGLDRAIAEGADCVLTLDADGQHDPDDIPAFLDAASRHPQALVLGDRSRDSRAIPRLRATSIAFGDFFISWAMARRLRDGQCGMRLYPTEFWKEVHMPEAERAHFVFETAILLHAAEAGRPFVRVPITARYEGYVQRPSRFRPILDSFRIARTVTMFILRRRFRPRGLLIALGVVR